MLPKMMRPKRLVYDVGQHGAYGQCGQECQVRAGQQPGGGQGQAQVGEEEHRAEMAGRVFNIC